MFPTHDSMRATHETVETTVEILLCEPLACNIALSMHEAEVIKNNFF